MDKTTPRSRDEQETAESVEELYNSYNEIINTGKANDYVPFVRYNIY